VTAKFDFASFHHGSERREQISATDSRARVILKCAERSRNAKSRWTVSQSAVQFCRMWRAWVGLLLLATPVWAEENATAYEALRVVGTELGRDALHQIVTITGSRGNPQPEKWKIVVEDPQGRGVRELQIADGKIDSDDEADRNVTGSTEGATIDVSRLNLDSSGAYAVASHTAEASHASFATADYTLRTDDRGEPMWIVTLRNGSSRPVGTIYIGGTRGTVRRTEGMFAGATMEDVEGDYNQGDVSSVIRNAKRSIKHGFDRAQEEARGMFEKVKRSFSDFINRE
jgi:hypothetical protein